MNVKLPGLYRWEVLLLMRVFSFIHYYFRSFAANANTPGLQKQLRDGEAPLLSFAARDRSGFSIVKQTFLVFLI